MSTSSCLPTASTSGLATVYRVLTQFEQAGLLIRHHFESGKSVFELNQGGHHDHLVCLQCGRVEEFFDPEIEKRQIKVAKERGFEISEHALYLYAECVKPTVRTARPGGGQLTPAARGPRRLRRLAAVEVGDAKAEQPERTEVGERAAGDHQGEASHLRP